MGLDQPMRLASELLQWPVNGWTILHISWPARKWKCPVLMANLLGSLESWKYAWSDLWKWSHSFWCLWESKNTIYQMCYHLQWHRSDLDPTAIFNAEVRVCLSLGLGFDSSSNGFSETGLPRLYTYTYSPHVCTGNKAMLHMPSIFLMPLKSSPSFISSPAELS